MESQISPRASLVKLAEVVTVTVLTTVLGAAVTVNEQVAVLDGTLKSVVGTVVALETEEVGDEADAGTVNVVPVTESASELPVKLATTVGTLTPDGVEETETVLTADTELVAVAVAATEVVELAKGAVEAAVAAVAVKSSTAETLRPLP